MQNKLANTALVVLCTIVFCQNGFTMTKCVNDAGRTIFTNTGCPAGYSDSSQPKMTSKPLVPIELEKPDAKITNNRFTLCEMVSIYEAGQYEGISLSIEKADCFYKIENQFKKPGEGNIFFALLISIQNNGDFKLYGGSSDYHGTFSVVTQDGFEIQALNTASTAWKENRMVWNADFIDIGDKRKGWIVFRVPEESTPKKVLFSVDRWDAPHQLTGMGTLSVSL